MKIPGVLGKAVRVARDDGGRLLGMRAVRFAANRLNVAALDDNIYDADVADSATLELSLPDRRPRRGTPLNIGWIVVPPARGSGGHTTLFRMIEGLETAGHRCTILIHDRHRGDLREQEQVIREWWPRIRASVSSAADAIVGFDACVASSWETAHVLACRATAPMRRLYFVQDYEPYFYPRGGVYATAEDTYRFGFRNIALGQMVAGALNREVGVDADVTQFGCDTDVYRPLPNLRRTGVVLYSRPDTPRRGFWLACAALARFHAMHPEVPIHLYGARVAGLPFPATSHGRLTPMELNELYNRCIAGIALSFTNISLVAAEMLAAGTIPVVNDSSDARADLRSSYVEWAHPTPTALATALSRAVAREGREERARLGARSVAGLSWRIAQRDVVGIVEDEVYGCQV